MDSQTITELRRLCKQLKNLTIVNTVKVKSVTIKDDGSISVQSDSVMTVDLSKMKFKK